MRRPLVAWLLDVAAASVPAASAQGAPAAEVILQIFNSTGELVRTYPTQVVGRTVTEFSLTYTVSGSCTTFVSDSGEPFSPDGDCRNDILVFDFPELTDPVTGARYDHLRWDGTTVGGQWVPNGAYLAQVQVNSTTFTGTITNTFTLSALRIQIVARIYNAAGEPVIELPAITNPGVVQIRVNPVFFEPDTAGTSIITFELLDEVGAVVGMLTWDGKNAQGILVPSGSYMISMNITAKDQVPVTITATFSVAQGGIRLISNVEIIPNPASTRSGIVWLSYTVVTSSLLTRVGVHVYSISGDLVASYDATGQPAPADPLDASGNGTGAVFWNLKNQRNVRVAPGLYVIVIEAKDQSGQRQLVKRKCGVVH